MRRLLFVLLFFVCSVIAASAQYYTNQNKIWAFGDNAGLDFNSGAPVAILTSINAYEGSASVCDASGSLLFYTDGSSVYNKNGLTMPLGASICMCSTYSSEQAALIIPVIGSSNQYYIFSLEGLEATSSITGGCHLTYSVVDMTLDGGLGDIISSSIATPLADSLGENIRAVPGNDNNIWLVTHKKDTALFLVYNVTSLGITPPVLSPIGHFGGSNCFARSMLKVSPNRRKIGQAILRVNGYKGNELYDFDPSTGIVSNEIILDTIWNSYGVEFSPDNSKLYFGTGYTGTIIQYNISLPLAADIIASACNIIDSAKNGDDLRLAPDGKIYFRSIDTHHMDCINYPNLAGTSCGYIPNVVTLVSGSRAFEGLPNLFVTTDTVNRVSVSELNSYSNTFPIYPNPATTQLTIQSTTQPITQINITNLLGQTVYSQSPTKNCERLTIDVSGFPMGVYFVKINDTEVRKFVKE